MFAIIVRPELLNVCFVSASKIVYSPGCTNCRLYENYNIKYELIGYRYQLKFFISYIPT